MMIDRICAALPAAIYRVLGIHSPSRIAAGLDPRPPDWPMLARWWVPGDATRKERYPKGVPIFEAWPVVGGQDPRTIVVEPCASHEATVTLAWRVCQLLNADASDD